MYAQVACHVIIDIERHNFHHHIIQGGFMDECARYNTQLWTWEVNFPIEIRDFFMEFCFFIYLNNSKLIVGYTEHIRNWKVSRYNSHLVLCLGSQLAGTCAFNTCDHTHTCKNTHKTKYCINVYI